MPINGVPMFIPVKKLHAFKVRLKGLRGSNFSDLSNRIAAAKQQLDTCQDSIQLDRRNTVLHSQEKVLKEQYLSLLNVESCLAKQQANVTWLQLGDMNTAFYHAKIKQRRANIQIHLSVIQMGRELLTFRVYKIFSLIFIKIFWAVLQDSCRLLVHQLCTRGLFLQLSNTNLLLLQYRLVRSKMHCSPLAMTKRLAQMVFQRSFF